jgi:hypothetical protein
MTTDMWTDSPTGSMAGRELAERISYAAVVVHSAARVAQVQGTGLPATGSDVTARFGGNDRISGFSPISDLTPNNGITLGIPSSRRPLS